MERKVTLYQDENDCFLELWKIVGTRKYVGRYTQPGEWVAVSDPLGYCEMDYRYPDDDVFIVCDKNGKELFCTKNGDGTAQFHTLEREAHEQMKKYMEETGFKIKVENPHAMFLAHALSGQPVGSLNSWLCSFQDPTMYKEAEDYAENWVYFLTEKVGEPEILNTYQYLGSTYHIERQHYKHKICDAKWSTIYAGGFYIGDEYDNGIVGTMYTESQACKLLTDAIKGNHPEKWVLSYVEERRPYGSDEKIYTEHKVKTNYAWEVLVGGRNPRKIKLRRDNIDALVEKEKKKSSFFDDYKEAAAVYPELIRDTRVLW